MDKFKTALAVIFLIGFGALLLWAVSDSLLACLSGRSCNENNVTVVGGLGGFALLGLLIWVVGKLRK